jgi:hypothetical protein
MRLAMSYREHRWCGIAIAAAYRGQGGCEVSNIAYAGHGVEIEEDVIRLRRRKLEFEGDAASRAHRTEPRTRRLRTLLPTRAMPAVIARWPWQR